MDDAVKFIWGQGRGRYSFLFTKKTTIFQSSPTWWKLEATSNGFTSKVCLRRRAVFRFFFFLRSYAIQKRSEKERGQVMQFSSSNPSFHSWQVIQEKERRHLYILIIQRRVWEKYLVCRESKQFKRGRPRDPYPIFFFTRSYTWMIELQTCRKLKRS